MLGWMFIVSRQGDAGAHERTAEAPSLAFWETGLGGTKWLDDLVAKGLATGLGGNGYPNRYTVAAGTVAAVLAQGVPKHGGPLVLGDDYVQPSGWTGDVKIDIARLRSLDPSEVLVVEAWDQS